MRDSFDVPTVREALSGASGASVAPWAALDVHESVDSTNLEALRRPQPWRVVVADHQSAGRGRLARQWQAPPRSSVAVSCVLPVPDTARPALGWLPLLAGMAMRGALVDLAGLRAGLKWPNDVMVRERPGGPWAKIAGVLCQAVADTGPGGSLVVVGAGANVDQGRDELPVASATSVRLAGGSLRREELVGGYLTRLADLHARWSAGGASLEALRAAYRQVCVTVGQEVDVHQPGGVVGGGRAIGVDDLGRLLVQAPDGPVAHAAGDVVHVRVGDRG